MQRHVRAIQLAALAAAAVIGLTLVGSPPADAGGRPGGGSSEPKIVATGLDNPRQLSFAAGDLLVAEAGEGGAGPCMDGPEGGTVCFGTTGAITKISSRGRQSRIITGLPSLAGEGTGGEAIGPTDVLGGRHGITVLLGLGADPAKRADLPAAGQRLGTLIETSRHHHGFRTVADLAAWEAQHNPIDDPDSNPVGLLYDHGRYVVADAGGNTVLSVGQRGRIRALASFDDRMVDAPPFLGLPPGTQIPMQAVPTSVAVKDHRGALYVSQLTGFPFPKGAANIYRIDPRSGAVTIYASGLTNVTDLAFRGKTLYAVQISSDGLLTGPVGSVVEVKRGGTTPADHAVIAGGLFAPYGIAIKGDHAYVTTGSVAKDAGQVIKIKL
ncbi:MAG TPA: ScyD/ScyE family protein [Candidatus Nanopelagicales bacterium]|nr:ScyD/ScyE family protein [Candidatus Nanopelagicales bacterium]